MYTTITDIYEDYSVKGAAITTDQKLVCKLYERYVLNTDGNEYGHVMARMNIFDDMVKVVSQPAHLAPPFEPTLTENMEATSNVLKMATEAGLEVETICWSLIYIRDNPGASIIEALQYGFDEWVNK